MGQHCVLSYLNLRGCSLNNEGVDLLKDGLIKNESLIELNLSNNGITEQGV
jgi:hypothetical protein